MCILRLFLALFLSFGYLFAEFNKTNLPTLPMYEQNQTSLEGEDLNKSVDGQNLADLGFKSEHKFSIVSLYEGAHVVVKAVIYILLVFSIIAWTVFIVKFGQFCYAFRVIKADEKALREIKFLDERPNFCKNSIAKIMFDEIGDEIKKSQIFDEDIKNRIERRLDSVLHKLSNRMRVGVALLASIGSSAPFIGLFGTVWGIMNSFMSIAASNNASLAVVAPGIAEALFATALGLVAAIPAVLFYNYFTRVALKFSAQSSYIAKELYLIAAREISQKERKC